MSQLKVNMQINFKMVIMVINHIHSLLAQETHNISYQVSPSHKKNNILSSVDWHLFIKKESYCLCTYPSCSILILQQCKSCK